MLMSPFALIRSLGSDGGVSPMGGRFARDLHEREQKTPIPARTLSGRALNALPQVGHTLEIRFSSRYRLMSPGDSAVPKRGSVIESVPDMRGPPVTMCVESRSVATNVRPARFIISACNVYATYLMAQAGVYGTLNRVFGVVA